MRWRVGGEFHGERTSCKKQRVVSLEVWREQAIDSKLLCCATAHTPGLKCNYHSVPSPHETQFCGRECTKELCRIFHCTKAIEQKQPAVVKNQFSVVSHGQYSDQLHNQSSCTREGQMAARITAETNRASSLRSSTICRKQIGDDDTPSRASPQHFSTRCCNSEASGAGLPFQIASHKTTER